MPQEAVFMEFLYVFSLMFLSIFGLTMLIKLAVCALFSRDLHRHDVYVRSGEDIGGFVEHMRRDPRVARVVVLSAGNDSDKEAQRLAEKYGNVFFIKTKR